MQNKKGFTLIELMIVVAIIAILAMIAVPMYQRYIERSRNAAAQAVLTQMSTAMVAFSVDNSTFLPTAAINTNLAIVNTLANFGFRADPNVGMQFLAPAAGQTGFVVYAAHRAPGSRLYVYDNINGSGVLPMGSLANFLDIATGVASTTAANAPCTSPLTLFVAGASPGVYATGANVNVNGNGIVVAPAGS